MTVDVETTEYAVKWEITVSANSPEEAARIAAGMARDPQSIATLFTVCDEEDSDDPNVTWETVDVPHGEEIR